MTSRQTLGITLGLLAQTGARAWGQDTNPALAAAIESYAPGMALSSDTGFVHTADFNGDGRQDVAAVLVGERKSALVIFNATRSGYQAHALYAALPAGSWHLKVIPPGRHRILGPEGAVEFASPAIELVFPGRSSAMYAWGGSRYQVYGTENYH